MSEKSFILSSAGLKNVVQSNNNFTFIFGKSEFQMSNVFAEFISPYVSSLHLSDPTINSFRLDYPSNANLPPLEELFTKETVSILQQISSGSRVSIKPEEADKLQQISILLGNNELFNTIQNLYSFESDNNNFDEYLKKLNFLQFQTIVKNIGTNIDLSSIIEHISSNFYKIDQNKLKQLSKPILYEIISNEHLKIESEDSLFDFINSIFEGSVNEEENDEITIYDFYEQIEYIGLSDEKFREFVTIFDPSKMTCSLWSKLRSRFLNENRKNERYNSNVQPIQKNSLKSKLFQYIGNSSGSFDGIINHLTKECGGNVSEKGVMNVTSGPCYDSYLPKNVVDLEDKNNGLITKNCQPENWILYDFKERKVKPTHYSIRSYDWHKNSHHLKSWVVEGSKTGQNDWKVLDTENNVQYLNDVSAFHTFEIKENLGDDEYFRFLRLRLTDKNYKGNNQLCITALEFFGYMIQN